MAAASIWRGWIAKSQTLNANRNTPVKMRFTNEQLRRRIEAEPEGVTCEAGGSMGFRALHDVSYYAVGKIADALDPAEPPDGDELLNAIHADLENQGRMHAEFFVSVHHRNIVLNAVARTLRKHVNPNEE